jgi:hypothetical protein
MPLTDRLQAPRNSKQLDLIQVWRAAGWANLVPAGINPAARGFLPNAGIVSRGVNHANH